MPRPNPSTRKVVFCYHSVHPKQSFISTRPDIFEEHVEFLKRQCQLCSLVDLVSNPKMSASSKPLAAITFDDGFEDNHSYALPILAKHGATATFFITAGFVERDPVVLERFQQLLGRATDDLVPLDWPQIRELRASGMDIGSHTYSHPNLARLSSADAENELRLSKELISDRLGDAIDLFAYPFGKPRVHFTSETTDRVRTTGYRLAASITFRGVRRTDASLNIPRFFADGDTVEKLEAKLQGIYDPLGWWQEHCPLFMMRAVSPDDFRR